MIRKVILPAAGLGTRFLPATKASPKEMLPIVDKPMIQYAVEEAEKCGINEFIIITGKNKRPIEDHFDIAFELEEILKKNHKDRLLYEINKLNNLSFAFIRQGKPLGLGHAILCARPFVGNEPFAVILSDDIIDPDETLLYDLIKIYEKYKAPVIALEEVPKSEVSRYGVIQGEKINSELYEVKALIEKPNIEVAPSNIVVIGRYILTPDIFELIKGMYPDKDGEYQLTDALNGLSKIRKLYGFVFRGKRYDAGDKYGFIKATFDFSLKRPEFSEKVKDYILLLARNLLKPSEP